MNSFTDIISMWPSDQAFADDLGETVSLVRVWKHRNSIPARHWKQVLCGAKKREFSQVTDALLIELANKRDAHETGFLNLEPEDAA